MDNIKLPKENFPKVEEVRYLENIEQEKKKLDEKQENKSKVIEKLEKTVLPTVHASDKDDDDFDAKIEYVDTLKESMEHDRAEKERMRQDAIANCDIL